MLMRRAASSCNEAMPTSSDRARSSKRLTTPRKLRSMVSTCCRVACANLSICLKRSRTTSSNLVHFSSNSSRRE